MANKKEDLRSKRSEAAIIRAFRELAMEKELKDITVTALAERAGINRKTFYLHYYGIDELVGELQQIFIRDVSRYMGDTLRNKDAQEAFFKTLCYLGQDPEWHYLLLSRYDYGAIYRVAEDPETRPWVYEEFFRSDERVSTIIAFLMGTLRTIFCDWYLSGMKVPPEEMARFGTQLAFSGVSGV